MSVKGVVPDGLNNPLSKEFSDINAMTPYVQCCIPDDSGSAQEFIFNLSSALLKLLTITW